MSKNYPVKIWEEKVVIPTYPVGEPEKNPMFFEKRVYQGSSGVVYPHPIIEKIYDEKRDKSYTGLFLENEYLKIMVLPELGGRIQMAYDKIKERHFVYYNHVIKPALVGLLGPWISGGIEFNWPQHHRPSTFQPVDYTIGEHADGSKTVWVSEIEKMFRTKGMAGFTLYPDKAYLEINVQLYNRTPLPQTFLWWANPAVSVNDNYQSVFPADVHAVFDHGKRDVSTFPIATGTYYKVNYSEGVDISRYKNLPVPTSYMAVSSDYDFIGGYEHDTEAGILHVADHHISPGKKQWTWGCGDFGKAWDRNLTDTDGPYIELMTGVYTDNQPDFSWLMPYEEKSFSQYFMPYPKLGVIKNASKDVLLSLDIRDEKASIKVFVTSVFKYMKVRLTGINDTYLEQTINLSPENVFTQEVPIPTDEQKQNLTLIVEDADGQELMRFQPEKDENESAPDLAKPALPPEEIASTEQLYLTGLHLEQYRHATRSPILYYEEALRKDPGDVRNNNALGRWYLQRGRFKTSESYFHSAIETLTGRNPNPYNGEPYYNLGVALKMQGRLDDAYDAFFKATWNGPWKEGGYYSLAQILTCKDDYNQALKHIEKSLLYNDHNQKGRHLKIALLRKTGQMKGALEFADESLQIDRFNFSIHYEQYLILKATDHQQKADKKLEKLQKLMRDDTRNYIESALDYANAGLYEEAYNFLALLINRTDSEKTYPMLFYFAGYFQYQLRHGERAKTLYKQAAQANPAYCFPYRLESIAVLQLTNELNPSDAKASYYIGNFWYANRQYDKAIAAWEHAEQLDESFPTVHRNLALAYYNKRSNPKQARKELERAFELDSGDARVLMELDQLYKKINVSQRERLELLEQHPDLVAHRDDLYLERATLYNQLGEYQTAKKCIDSRKFHPWEGGEGKVPAQYVLCRLQLAKKAINGENYSQAVNLLLETEEYPPHLGEGKLYGAHENDIYYYLGCAYEGLGQTDKANTFFEKASSGLDEPEMAMYYNDQQPDKIFYQGLANLKLGRDQEAGNRFEKLIRHGKKHLHDNVSLDYFAVSLPDLLIFDENINQRNKNHCNYLIGLGNLGLKRYDQAKKFFDTMLETDINHQGARIHLEMIKNKEKKLDYGMNT